jgi:hypothetical protein
MPPQIKSDLNRSGWETTDFPSVCEKCLPDNPYVQMLKEDHGAVSTPTCCGCVPCADQMVGMQDLHASLHNLPLEGRPHIPTEAHQHLPDMRAPQELLPVLHAGPVVWSTAGRA